MQTFHITASHSVDNCGYGNLHRSQELLKALQNLTILEKKWKCKLDNYYWDIVGHTCYLVVKADNHYQLNMFLLEVLGGVNGVRSSYNIVPVITLEEMKIKR
tara:strand:- start:627 stop:932 length:306 start_codon:yes stop_codon:yes gene_type:complete